MIVTTLDALRGLLGFLGGQESLSRDVVFVHSALVDASPLLWLLPEPHRDIKVEGFLCWMQRIVNIDLAMTARGWPARAAGRAELEVTDPVTGVERVVLEVESGSAGRHPAEEERFDAVSAPSPRGTRARSERRMPSGWA